MTKKEINRYMSNISKLYLVMILCSGLFLLCVLVNTLFSGIQIHSHATHIGNYTLTEFIKDMELKIQTVQFNSISGIKEMYNIMLAGLKQNSHIYSIYKNIINYFNSMKAYFNFYYYFNIILLFVMGINHYKYIKDR